MVAAVNVVSYFASLVGYFTFSIIESVYPIMLINKKNFFH